MSEEGDEMTHLSREVELPEISIVWTKEEKGLVSNEIKLDLGALGKFSLGPLTFSKEMLIELSEEELTRERKNMEREVRVAFMRVLCRFAALAVVELGKKPDVLLGWYSHMMEEKTGDDTIYHAISDEDLKVGRLTF